MLRIVLLLLLTTASMATFAQDNEQLWQAIEQLRMRIDRLESEAGIIDEQKKEETDHYIHYLVDEDIDYGTLIDEL